MRYIGIETKIPPEVLKIAKQVRWGVLKRCGVAAGECHPSSERIVKLLGQLGIRAVVRSCYFIIAGQNKSWHYVVRVGDKILDVTADQFNHALREHDQSVRMRAIVYGKNAMLDDRYELHKR